MASIDQSFETLFNPDSVALIGASADPEKLSGRPARYLEQFEYGGSVHLVNPSQESIDGKPCYDSITDVPEHVDVALVLVPARVVPAVIRECGEHGVSFAIVIASGFAETGDEGAQLQEKVLEIAQEHDVRLIGPNSQGLVELSNGVALSFSSILKRDEHISGNVSFVSQSGAFGGAIYQLIQNAAVGVSKWITTGNEADVDTLDIVNFYVDDPETNVVVAYVESITEGYRLQSISRRAKENDTKIVVMCAGISDAGREATASHTGSIATDEAIYDAAFDQTGVTRVWGVDEFKDTVTAYSRLGVTDYPDSNSGIGVISMSGGAAAMIADACDRYGVPLPALSVETKQTLQNEIPRYGSMSNPVDVTGAAISSPQVFERCVMAVVNDDNVGALLLQFGNSGKETIEVCKDLVIKLREESSIPIAAVFTGNLPRPETAAALSEVGVLQFEDPTRAVSTLAKVFKWSQYRTRTDAALPKTNGVGKTFSPSTDWDAVTSSLASHDIQFAPSGVAQDAEMAVDVANEIGYPVVAKLNPLEVAHKVDVGGVITGLDDEEAVKDAYEQLDASNVVIQKSIDGVELILGVIDDPDFGPVMLFGPGGVFVELLDDVFTYRMLPVTDQIAREMIDESKAKRLMEGYRDKQPVDIEAVVATLVAVSDVYAATDVSELELNPVIATPDGCFAVDLLIEERL